MTKPVWARALTLCMALLLSLAVALPASAEKVLNRGNGAEPKGLDPHQASGDPENQILGDMFIGLYTEDVAGNTILGAADAAQTSPDGLTWTFKIRDHKWSDGAPVTAEDFVYAYRRILSPTFAAEYANIMYPIKNAQKVKEGKLPPDQLGVSAPDPKTLVLTLEHPAPYLPEMMTHYSTFPIPKHVVEKAGLGWTKQGVMVSNGPYMMTERRPNDHITLLKNPHFYDAANVKIDKVVFYPSADSLAALKRYRAGELDTLDRWPLTENNWLKANIPNEMRGYTGLRVQYDVFNMRRGPLADKRVRMALAEAIDREAVLRDVYFGVYGAPADSVIPPGMANVDRSAKVPWAGKTMDERRAEAKQLLAAAGFGPSNPLKLSYNFINSPDNKRLAVAQQNMWKQIGVQIELNAKDFAIHYDLLKSSNFEIAWAGWIYDYNDVQSVLFLFESSNTGLNYPGYKNEAFDALLRQGDNEKDVAVRGQLLGKAAGLLIGDVAIAPNSFQYVRPLIKPYVLNWENTLRGVNRTRWLDIGDKAGPDMAGGGTAGGAQASEGGFWSWLGSWFSPEAWQKWWNS
jgi:oligopeptide transport system substrate-binding protein